MNDLDRGLDDLYQEYWMIHSQKLNDHDPLQVAGVLLAQAMTIYRTVLTDKAYNTMVDSISEMRNDVKILTPDLGGYH